MTRSGKHRINAKHPQHGRDWMFGLLGIKPGDLKVVEFGTNRPPQHDKEAPRLPYIGGAPCWIIWEE